MKLIVKSGESIEHAIQYLSDFLKKYEDDYFLLKGNMNIYITLEGVGHTPCLDNDKEFVLSAEDPEDVERNNIQFAKEKVLAGWKRFFVHECKKVQSSAGDVEFERRYIESAEKRGLKPVTIERHKSILLSCEKKHEEVKRNVNLLLKLNEIIEKEEAIYHFVKFQKGNALYSYTITPYIIFENVDEKFYHFVGYESKYKTYYGYLQSGLPHGYSFEQKSKSFIRREDT